MLQQVVFMKFQTIKYLSLLFAAIFVSNHAQAQLSGGNTNCPFGGTSVDGSDCNNTIITAVPFLRIVPDARFGAMGDAGIALSADPNTIHFNASNLTFAERDFSVSATFTPWLRALGLNDVFLAYLSGYKHIDHVQTIGASLRFFSLGSIQFTDEQGTPLQTVKPNEFELAAAYARKLGKYFSTGITLKYIFSNLGNGAVAGGQTMRPAHAFAADVSFTYRKPMKVAKKDAILAIGLAFSNLGTKVSYTQSANRDYIPANLGLGASFEYNFDKHNSLTLAFDINKLLVPTPAKSKVLDDQGNLIDNPEFDVSPADGIPDYKQQSVPASIFTSFGDAPGGGVEEISEFMFSVGLEYWYNKQFAVRFGHYNEHKFKGNRKFLTVGLGLRYNIFNINFSYLIPWAAGQRNPLDNTLRFSLIFDFGKAPTKKKGK